MHAPIYFNVIKAEKINRTKLRIFRSLNDFIREQQKGKTINDKGAVAKTSSTAYSIAKNMSTQ